MARDKVSVTLDQAVLAAADADAKAAGLNRSELVEPIRDISTEPALSQPGRQGRPAAVTLLIQ